MARKRQSPLRRQAEKQNLFQEAWQNMLGDMDKFLPEKLHGNKGKKKFVLWLFVLEILVLGVAGKFVYDWIVSR